MYRLKIPKDDYIEILNIHCRNKFPREFARQSESGRSFSRNMYVSDAEGLYNYIEFFDFINCYVSVYSFPERPEDGTMWDRSKAIIDSIFLDFDSKHNPSAALKEVKKVLTFFDERGIVPLVYFSGSKGYHIYGCFSPVQIKHTKEVLKKVTVTLVEKLELKTLDLNVAEVARVSRIPLTINSKSGLPCTPISPTRLMKMDHTSVIKFVKAGKYDKPEYEESEYLKAFLEYADSVIEETERVLKEKYSTDPIKRVHTSEWRQKRIEHYTNALRKYGRLAADTEVKRIHSQSEWVAAVGGGEGAIEHIARVHLILLLIEEGYSDEEIHRIFSLAKDYDRQRTQYYIDYNRRRVRSMKGAQGA